MAAGAIVQGSFRLAINAIVDSDVPPVEMLPIWELDTVIAVLVWGGAGLVATMWISAFAFGLLPKPLAGVGVVVVVATIALTPTDHGGVSLTLLLWLSTARPAMPWSRRWNRCAISPRLEHNRAPPSVVSRPNSHDRMDPRGERQEDGQYRSTAPASCRGRVPCVAPDVGDVRWPDGFVAMSPRVPLAMVNTPIG